MMTNDALLEVAVVNTAAASDGLKEIARIGREEPVPAMMLTVALLQLRGSMAAVTELERRARGGEIPRQG